MSTLPHYRASTEGVPIDVLTRRGKPIHECVRPDDGSWNNKYANKPVTPPTPNKYSLVHAQSLPSCTQRP